LDPAEGLEGPDVVLAAGLEADVDERGAVGDDDGEDVAEHGGIGLAVLRLGGAGGPCDVEDVGDVGEGLEGLLDGGASARSRWMWVTAREGGGDQGGSGRRESA
jgi:hypothetical protein